MYQVIEKLYVGIDQDLEVHRDADHIEISRLADDDEDTLNYTGNYRHKDWSVTVYGCYPSLAEAAAAVKIIFVDVRAADPRGNAFEAQDSGVVAVFKPGKYYPVGNEGTYETTRNTIATDVTAFTTDEEIDVLVETYQGFANRHGFIFHSSLRDRMVKQREMHQEEFVIPVPQLHLVSQILH
jgi:hypothetical protein